MKVLYFDCFSGAAGDMILGALLDAGLPIEALRGALGSLAVEGWEISADRVLRAGITATKFRVHEGGPAHPHAPPGESESARAPQAHGDEGHSHPHHHGPERADRAGNQDAFAPVPHAGTHPHDHDHVPLHAHGDQAHEHAHGGTTEHDHPHQQGGRGAHGHRSIAEIYSAIDRSSVSAAGKKRAKSLFGRLADTEAAVHGTPMERVHLHEVGALDSIIDVVGCVFGLEWFGADRIVVSPINLGSGTVKTAHGLFPVPAPATVRLLEDVPVYSSGVRAELLTPTGALILSDYASSYGPIPPMRVVRVGYGAGDRDLPSTPNTLRLLVGEAEESGSASRVVVIECEIDDMNPQLFGPLMDRLSEGGALDIFYSSVQMKKSRPGTLVTIVAPPERQGELATILFRETTTIGVRYQEMTRECLEREIRLVSTELGDIRFKVASRAGKVMNAQPEFDDVARLALARAVPAKEVQAAAWKAWLEGR